MTNDPLWRLPEVPAFSLLSPDFAEGERLPHWARSGIAGAGGDDRSPALEWTGAPNATQSYVVAMYDPDAPTGSGWWHWTVYNIPATTTSLTRNAGEPDADLLPAGAVTVANEPRLERFLGAAPPSGHGDHRDVFAVSALDVPSIDVPQGATPALVGFILRDHIVGRALLTGIQSTD